MERKIGEVFTYNNKLYQVVKGFSCNDCAFIKDGSCYSLNKLLGSCGYIRRSDKTNVVFKEIKNMEIKNNQLTIEIPKGMEIDTKNSDLAKGIIKFKPKNLTYDNILETYATDFGGLRVPNHCIDKILAISQLMNIAKYYNGDWKPNWHNSEDKYYIIFRYDENCYSVASKHTIINNNVFFKNEEDAQAVIDNLNFMNILDNIYKN